MSPSPRAKVIPFHRPKNTPRPTPPHSYQSYMFTDKDPIIFEVEAAIANSGLSYAEIERRSGVTPPTLKAWFTGKTRRPMHSTIKAVIRAIGYDYVLVKMS